jgi:hypothetical protein
MGDKGGGVAVRGPFARMRQRTTAVPPDRLYHTPYRHVVLFFVLWYTDYVIDPYVLYYSVPCGPESRPVAGF